MIDITPTFIIGALVRIVISSIVLYLSVRLLKGKANFKNSIILVVVMEALNSFLLPMFFDDLMSLAIYVIVWLILVMKFFKVSFWRAVFIAIAQGLVVVLLVFVGTLALLGSIIGILALVK